MIPARRSARLPGALELPYVDVGARRGAPVVFVHAYADSWRSFEVVLTSLPQSIRAVAPTQRGHGDATKPETGYRVEDFAGDLLALLDLLEIERSVLVASSSAAFTVEQLAVEQPERVSGLVLIGAPWSLAERAPSFDFVESVRALNDPVDPSFVRDFVAGTSSDRVPHRVLDAMVEESRKVPAHVWKQTLAGVISARPPRPGAIASPTLVIWGERDGLITARGSRALPGCNSRLATRGVRGNGSRRPLGAARACGARRRHFRRRAPA